MAICGIVFVFGALFWDGINIKIRREESFRQADIENSQVDIYQGIFDVNNDGEDDYVVKLKDGSARIVHGYKSGQ